MVERISGRDQGGERAVVDRRSRGRPCARRPRSCAGRSSPSPTSGPAIGARSSAGTRSGRARCRTCCARSAAISCSRRWACRRCSIRQRLMAPGIVRARAGARLPRRVGQHGRGAARALRDAGVALRPAAPEGAPLQHPHRRHRPAAARARRARHHRRHRHRAGDAARARTPGAAGAVRHRRLGGRGPGRARARTGEARRALRGGRHAQRRNGLRCRRWARRRGGSPTWRNAA